MDEFQTRYLDHQDRKTKSLEDFKGNEKIKYSLIEQTAFKEIMMNRRSQRKFNDEPTTFEDFIWILTSIQTAPSSCNRQAIYIKLANSDEIEKFLVGGKKWIDKADKVLLLFASREAYKNPVEVDYMPYLDAGMCAENIYLMCEALGLGACFVNPNIREENLDEFDNIYKTGADVFCGAIAIGNYDKKAKVPPLREANEVLK